MLYLTMLRDNCRTTLTPVLLLLMQEHLRHCVMAAATPQHMISQAVPAWFGSRHQVIEGGAIGCSQQQCCC
jgi:hypothetical protein